MFSCKTAYKEMSRTLVKADFKNFYFDSPTTSASTSEKQTVEAFVQRNNDIIVTFNQISRFSDWLTEVLDHPGRRATRPTDRKKVMDRIEELVKVCYCPALSSDHFNPVYVRKCYRFERIDTSAAQASPYSLSIHFKMAITVY